MQVLIWQDGQLVAANVNDANRVLIYNPKGYLVETSLSLGVEQPTYIIRDGEELKLSSGGRGVIDSAPIIGEIQVIADKRLTFTSPNNVSLTAVAPADTYLLEGGEGFTLENLSIGADLHQRSLFGEILTIGTVRGNMLVGVDTNGLEIGIKL